MDSLETSSISSRLSDNSDCLSSNFSNVSICEDELNEIIKYNNFPTLPKQKDPFYYENKIKSLTANLDNSNKLIEKLKKQILEQHCKHELQSLNCFQFNSIINDDYYKETIKDMQFEMDCVKLEILQQESLFESIKKQNGELLQINTLIQKKLSEKEYENNKLQQEIHNVEEEMESNKKLLKERENELMQLTTDNKKIQNTLNSLTDENQQVESIVKILKENFNKLLHKFNNIKNELELKEQIISKFECCREDIHNNNNKTNRNCQNIDSNKLASLEEMSDKFKNNVNLLQQENLKLNRQVICLEEKIEKLNKGRVDLLQNLSEMKEQNKQLIEDCHKEKFNYYEKTNLLNSEIELLNKEVGNLETMIERFRQEKDDFEEEKTRYMRTTRELEQTVENLKCGQSKELIPYDRNDLFIQLTTLLKLLTDKNERDSWKRIESLSNDLLRYDFSMKSLLETVKKVYRFKTDIVSKNQKYEEFIALIKDKLLNGMKEADEKFTCLKDRQGNLEEKISSMTILCRDLTSKIKRKESINTSTSIKNGQEIESFKVILQAKDLEIKEIQQKYQMNNRTLLRKVKEQMKMRKSSEEQCAYLKELYDANLDELNTLKLVLSTCEYELQNSRNDCENYKIANEKLMKKLIELQTENRESDCKNCQEFKELIEEKENSLLLTCKILEEKENQLVLYKRLEKEFSEISEKKETIHNELESLKRKQEGLRSEIGDKDERIAFLEESLNSLKTLFKEITEKLVVEQERNIETRRDKNKLMDELSCLLEEKKIISDRIEVLSSKLNEMREELNFLRGQKRNVEFEMQNSINSLNNENRCLKNHCSEIKVALEVLLKQYKFVKEEQQKLPNENKNKKTDEKTSNSNFSEINKLNEDRIKELIDINNSPLPNPFPKLNDSLSSLKQEVFNLRNKVLHNFT